MGKPNNPNEKFAEKHIQNAFRKGNAKQLGLTGYGLTHFPNSILQLTSLEKLFLGGNEFKELPKKISKLKKLRELYLFNNNLKKLPDSFGELNQLRQLHLGENKLQELPDSFRNLKSLTLLKLHGNENLGMPPEILGDEWGRYEEGKYVKPSDIIDYYFRLKAGSRPLNEAKLILLGRGEVGKTSLVNRLVHNKFNPTTMTQGISITQWPIVIGIDNIRLNIWDFGGQEIQHSTHQFFLTERSLYLVVLNGRAGAEDEDAEYWLKFVKTFGGSSPTIVVLNKSEIQPFEVNRRALIEKYPFIHSFVVTDCLPDQNEGISLLRENIKAALNGMDHIRAKFPVDWFRIKERLANLESPFISFGEYRKICNELGEKTLKAQEALARFLNALGIALNYRDDPKLRDESVLNPHWITQGVYKIITSKTLVDKHGELQLSDLNEILDPQNYPKRMHGFILELMRKFELCFLYHDDPAEQRYLVPELLGKEQPELKDQFPPTECLNFRYDYKLMPEGILPRFITRTHTMSDKNERWRTGVVLRWEGCRAIVKADKQDRQVVIRVLGKPEKRRRLMAVIRENFDQIHSEMKEFRPTEWLGLEGHPEEWLDRQELEVFEKQKETQIRKRVGEKVLSVDVTKVLNDADVPGARKDKFDFSSSTRPLKLFVSYAHPDEKWRALLTPNLELLQREGLIEIWSDRQIVPGSKWDNEIQRKMEEADLFLFLMSTDLLNSQYIREKELPFALKKYQEEKAGFVPVIARRCSWKKYVGEIQGLPMNGKAISDWKPFDNACFDIEQGLRKTIEVVYNKLMVMSV